jgi:hypothetical protein
MKRIVAIFAALLMAFTASSPASARTFVPEGVDPRAEDKIAFVVEDHRDTPRFVSILSRDTNMDQVQIIGNRWCRSFSTDNCRLEEGYVVRASAILPVCVANESNCIEGLSLQISGSAPVRAQNVAGLEEGFTFESIEALGTPRGAGPSLWNAEGIRNDSGSSQYVVAANLTFVVINGTTVLYEGLSAAVYPVEELTGPRYKAPVIGNLLVNGATMWYHDNGEQGSNDGCTLTTAGKCWARTGFQDGVRAEVSMRVAKGVSGWLHGRLKDPEIAIEALSTQSNRIVVGAESVDVPVMYAETPYSNLETEVKEWLRFQSGYGGFAFGKQWLVYPSFNPYARKLISRFASSVNDQASAVYSSWQFNTMSSQPQSQSCISQVGGLVGLVTTNAMAYDQYAPAFRDGSLDYSVAGLHLLPDGEKAIGVYDLVMRSDVARCLYGFSKAPVSAKVSVLTSDGESIVATTQVSEKNGWLKLSAYGFTFSEKKISVRVLQPQALTLAKFKTGMKALSTVQRTQLDDFATLSNWADKITCTATYFGAKNKGVAIAQAKAACRYLEVRVTGAVFEIKTLLVKAANSGSKVYLKSS